MKWLLLPLILSTSVAAPASALTWAEFWEPFTEEVHVHHYPRYRRPYKHWRPDPSRMYCVEIVEHEEYIAGDYSRSGRWRPGWIRRWTERRPAPCHR